MAEASHSPLRRTLILGGIVTLGALASCRSVLPTAEGAGASRAAAAHIGTIRSAHGLSVLRPDTSVEAAALEQARFMVMGGRMDHTALAGRDFVSRMKRKKIPAPAAENLAHGRMDLDRLFAMWMNSDGHRRNMLDPRFSRFGLAYAQEDDGSRYWALVLSA